MCVSLNDSSLCHLSVSLLSHILAVFLREGCMGRGRPLYPSWIHTMVRLHILLHCMSEHGMFVPMAAPPDTWHGLMLCLCNSNVKSALSSDP